VIVNPTDARIKAKLLALKRLINTKPKSSLLRQLELVERTLLAMS